MENARILENKQTSAMKLWEMNEEKLVSDVSKKVNHYFEILKTRLETRTTEQKFR